MENIEEKKKERFFWVKATLVKKEQLAILTRNNQKPKMAVMRRDEPIHTKGEYPNLQILKARLLKTYGANEAEIESIHEFKSEDDFQSFFATYAAKEEKK